MMARMGAAGLTDYDDECARLGDADSSDADDEIEERAWLTSLAATQLTNGEDTVMGQTDQEPFGFDETSAVFTTATEVGLREDVDAPEFSAEECDAALTALDTQERVEEALDAVSALPFGAQSDELMRVTSELLGKLDDERAMAVMVERACRLAMEDVGCLARQHLLVLFNAFEARKRDIEAAVERKREAEVALIQALGPCAGLAFEAAE